jgi:hypothetical protein
LRTNLPEPIEWLTRKGAPPTAELRNCVSHPLRSRASALLPESMEWFHTRRVPAVGVRLRTNPCRSSLASEPSVTHRIFEPQDRPRGRTAGSLRARRVPAVGVRLRTNLLRSLGARRVRAQARSYRGRPGGRYTPCLRCRSPLADEPSRTHRMAHTQRPMHMDVLVPRSTGMCESGQCTGMCWCREAQGCARAALPANGQRSQGSAGQPPISGKA